MKNKHHAHLIPLMISTLSLVAVATVVAFSQVAYANTVSRYSFTTSKIAYNVGETFTVTANNSINLYSGSTASGVIATSSHLQIVSASSGSRYYIYHNTAANTVQFYGSALGTTTIATLTVKALAAGNATMSYPNATVSGASTTRDSLALTINAPSCPAGQIGTPPNCSTPAPPPAPAPAPSPAPAPAPAPTPTDVCPNIAGAQSSVPTGMVKDGSGNCVTPAQPTPAAPTRPPGGETLTPEASSLPKEIIDLKVNIKYYNADATWVSDNPNRTFEITYRANGKEDVVIPAVADGKGNYKAILSELDPYTTYTYTLAGTGESANITYDGEFTTFGLPVRIIVLRDGQPVKNAVFFVEGAQIITGENGEALIELAAREYVLSVQNGDKTVEKSIVVLRKEINEDGSGVEEQSFTVDLANSGFALPMDWRIAAGVGAGTLLLVAGGVFVLVRKRRAMGIDNANTPSLMTPLPTDLNEIPDQPFTANEPISPIGSGTTTEDVPESSPAPLFPAQNVNENPLLSDTPPAPDLAPQEIVATQPEVADATELTVGHGTPLSPIPAPEAAPVDAAPLAATNEPQYAPEAEHQSNGSMDPWDGQSQLDSDTMNPDVELPEEPQVTLPEPEMPVVQTTDSTARPKLSSVHLDEELPEDMFEAAKHRNAL